MGISDIFKKAKNSHSQNENEVVINTDNEKKSHALSQSEKMDEIIALLKGLTAAIVQHDHHLTIVNNNIQSHISELSARKKDIPEDKKIEVEGILKKTKDRGEAIEKLKAMGISQATAYRYTEFLKGIDRYAVDEGKSAAHQNPKPDTS
jgi:hypothetical protein